MADTDEEQVELLKKWFDENGTSLLVSIVLVLVVVFGYRTWETQTHESAEAASALYEELIQAVSLPSPNAVVSEENISTAKFLAEQLKQEHTSSTYAHFAALHLAKMAVQAGELETAAEELQWVLDNGANDRVAVIANLRLAKVKFGGNELESALAQLEETDAGSHRSSYLELKGDVLYALDRKDEAREAYQLAVNLQTNIKPMVQMKLDDLVLPRVVIPAAETDSADENSPVVEED